MSQLWMTVTRRFFDVSDLSPQTQSALPADVVQLLDSLRALEAGGGLGRIAALLAKDGG